MDKYQLNLLNRATFKFFSEVGEEKIEVNEKVFLHQNEDYTLKNYRIEIDSQSIALVTYRAKKYVASGSLISVDFDFDNIGSELIISFKNGLADDCSVPIEAVLADKGAFDAKTAKEQREQLISNAALVVKNGDALINVFWKKANEQVVKSIVKVYYYHRPTSGDSVEYLICEKETESLYLSLTGLAYGEYRCVVEEYSSKGLVIAVEGHTRLEDPVKVMKEESRDIKEHLKGVGRAAGGHWVHN